MNPKIFELISQYQMEKNEGAIMILWEEFRPLVISLIRRFYIPPGRQEDVFQDAFIQLLACAASYDGSGQMPFEGYYKLQLQYWFLNQIRKKTEILSVDYDWPRGVSMTDLMASTIGNAQDLLVAGETSSQLVRALECLTDRQREAVILFYLEDMTLAQVAAKLGCSYNVAYKHKDAGLKNIRRMMA